MIKVISFDYGESKNIERNNSGKLRKISNTQAKDVANTDT